MGGIGAIWRFLKRHKRKIFFVSTVATGAYFTWQYVSSWVVDYKDRQMVAAFAAARRQTHFDSNQRTCNATVYSMMPGLREALMDELNCEKLTEQLQLKPTNKVYIWSELKILSFTRAVASIYSTSILILTLRIQLNIVGGCIYARNERIKDSPLTDEESQIQQKYLETIQFFLTTGIRNLCNLVRHNVERELMNVSLKETFSSDSLAAMINRVRVNIEKGSSVKVTPFLDFISPTLTDATITTEASSHLSLSRLIGDTNDILKSEDYHVVLQATIDNGFKQLFAHLHKACAAITSDSQSLPSPSRFTSENQLSGSSIALAKLIPPLVGTVHVTCSDTMTDYLQQLLTLRCIDDFAYQIYESFCQSEETL